jgi:hypothetical protein
MADTYFNEFKYESLRLSVTVNFPSQYKKLQITLYQKRSQNVLAEFVSSPLIADGP